MIEHAVTAKVLVSAVFLGLLWWLEAIAPLFLNRRHKLTRIRRHLFLAVFNGLLVVPLFSLAAVLASSPGLQGRGMLAWLDLSALVETILAIALIDFWMYLWHRANHSIPWLWRLHCVHHSDPELDSTSAFRFHTGEIVLSSVFRLMLIPLLSLQLWQMALYDLLMLPVIIVHHSNFNMPARLDSVLRVLIVTPWMHWVHHSRYQPETNSNFSTIFSVWDRLFVTFRLVSNPRAISFGLDEFRDERWQDLKGLLVAPFVSPGSLSERQRPEGRDRVGRGNGPAAGRHPARIGARRHIPEEEQRCFTKF